MSGGSRFVAAKVDRNSMSIADYRRNRSLWIARLRRLNGIAERDLSVTERILSREEYATIADELNLSAETIRQTVSRTLMKAEAIKGDPGDLESLGLKHGAVTALVAAELYSVRDLVVARNSPESLRQIPSLGPKYVEDCLQALRAKGL